MLKTALIAFCFFLSISVVAQEVDVGVAEKLNAKKIIQLMPERCDGQGVTTPVQVWYVKEGDKAPSCGLLLADGKYIDLVSPEPGLSLPACAKAPSAPRVVKAGDTFLLYDFSVEDPKAVVSMEKRLFKVTQGGLHVCENEDQLIGAALIKEKEKGVEEAYKSVLKKYGCR